MQANVGVDPAAFARQLMRAARKVAEEQARAAGAPLEPTRILEEAYEQSRSITGTAFYATGFALPKLPMCLRKMIRVAVTCSLGCLVKMICRESWRSA